MQPPVDYPVNEDTGANTLAGTSLAGPITYAALLDRFAAEQPITADMIHAACLSMEAAQQFPFATRPRPVSRHFTEALSTDGVGNADMQTDDVISRLLKNRLLKTIR
jgi:hypothetical protein